ncbi:MAG: preprotein translocase subunit SecY [Patescibacteria group bacterium]|nr:preprotein translocase subunit SecY [Patescibacteria group bacterium]MDE1945838.1 preprotein translocase subunit SecY [Patescibacteria group bacterium]
MKFSEKLGMIWQDKGLRGRILFLALTLLLSRLLATIPVPGINAAKLDEFFSGSQFFSFLNIFSGGGMSRLSIVMLGVSPYITASVAMQLLTMVSGKLKSMYQEEGDAGRAKFNQISRVITVPIAFLQAFGFLSLLASAGIIANLTRPELLVNMVVITAGSMLFMWLGELMTEFGIGNGVSLLIFAGIVASLPGTVSQLSVIFSVSEIPMYVLLAAFTLAVIYGVVFISEAERPVPVTYAKTVRGGATTGGMSTYLPLRIAQAGVMPIIFGMSILLFPQMIFKYLSTLAASPTIKSISATLNAWISNVWIYGILYFVLVFLFTYFYTAVTFDPDQIAKNLQQSGAFIPGVRPGQATSEYLAKVLTRITLVGATFLAVLAVLPFAVRSLTGITSLAVGGTALLIVVSVIIDLIKKVDAQITMREY